MLASNSGFLSRNQRIPGRVRREKRRQLEKLEAPLPALTPTQITCLSLRLPISHMGVTIPPGPAVSRSLSVAGRRGGMLRAPFPSPTPCMCVHTCPLWSHQAPLPPCFPSPRRWWLTSCCRNPAKPLLPVRRAARGAGRGTGHGAGSWHCAGRGQEGRHSQGHRSRYIPPQGPAPGTAEGTGPPPGGTVQLSGTPCPLGTGLDGKTERASAGKGQEMEGWKGTCMQVTGGRPLPESRS